MKRTIATALSLSLMAALFPVAALALFPCTAKAQEDSSAVIKIINIANGNPYEDYVNTSLTSNFGKKTHKIKGSQTERRWQSYNPVKVSFRCEGQKFFGIELQRSKNQFTGFEKVEEDEESGCLVDKEAPRGTTFYYRIKAEYYDRSAGRPAIKKEIFSDVASIRTYPKTLVTTGGKVKEKGKWKKKAKWSWSKKKTHTYKITWEKRTDVDGYYVYKGKLKVVLWNKLKSSHYTTGSYYTIMSGTSSSYETISKKNFKKVKTLGANARSYTFKFKDRTLYDHCASNPYYYVVVPFVKEGDKTVVLDADKVYYPRTLGTWDLSYPSNTKANVSIARDRKFSEYVPFPL